MCFVFFSGYTIYTMDDMDNELEGFGDRDWEAVPCYYAAAYLTLFSGAAIKVPIQGSDDEIDRP